jgi:hypothetical protein
MTRLLAHFKSNVIAYLALFVALGGTSYAALRLPAGSVGSRQLKNHSVTPSKLDSGSIGGYVRYWAKVGTSGTIVESRPRAHLVGWNSQPGTPFPGGLISWNRAIPRSCFALATVANRAPGALGASAELISDGNNNAPGVGVNVLLPEPQTSVNVAVICPQP